MANLRIAALGFLWVSIGTSAEAYEFEVKARTVAQGRSLQALRILGPSQTLTRRRITQSLQLHLWDLTGSREGLSLYDSKAPSGPRLYFTSYVRVDQDFGSFAAGQIQLSGRTQDALDVVPELSRNVLQLDLLYAYAGAEGLWGGKVDAFAGRLLEVKTLDWFSVDGLKVAAHLPARIGVELLGGLRVRDSSPLGFDAFAPDGSSGASCEEYVEAAVPGSGSWRPIDGLPLSGNNPFASDNEICPQRNIAMPTVGASLFLEGLPALQARVSYRRTQSRSVGIIEEPDRLEFEDLGFYPNEAGQTPTWGVNEERLALTLRAPLPKTMGFRFIPHGAVRYSLLHGLVDEAHLGVEVSREAHTLESEIFYSYPTFDGDSIFNIFSTEPYTDARTTWEYRPSDLSWGGYVRGWGRRYHSEDQESLSGLDSANDYAGGAQVGLQYEFSSRKILRLDLFHEDGYGGLRSGGYARARFRLSRKTDVSAGLSGIRFDADQRDDLHGINLGSQLGTSYQVHKGFAASLRVEHNSNRTDRFQLAVFAFLDLAFQPET